MVDVAVSQVVEQIIEAPKISSQDHGLQQTVDVSVVMRDQVRTIQNGGRATGSIP